ncbi:MAG: MlaD family protein [Spirochaetaceae bacterium]|jgi:phospholipid/cholesterol/gamma-HCH transport system substrate-binding protein|nr:MlaD family protein [Spirochaetaceae bacterium]
MKFRIRFADKIVGFFIIAALAALAFIIFMLGRSQRWFRQDYEYLAYFESAVGLSPNMEVQYKGFPIGRIKSRRLAQNDQVEAVILIYDTYADRVREGSLVELQISPIGLGNRFQFYPGLGAKLLEEGSAIPRVGTPIARLLIEQGLASVPFQSDSVTLMVSQVNTLLEQLNKLAGDVEGALKGDDETAIGRVVQGVEKGIGSISGAADDIGGVVGQVYTGLEPILAQVDGLVANLKAVSADLETVSSQLAAPGGTVSSILDGGGPVYSNLDASLSSIAGILRNLEKTAAFIPPQLPQIGRLIAELNEVLQGAEGLLVSLRNNPLLRNGFPEQQENQSTGSGARDISF